MRRRRRRRGRGGWVKKTGKMWVNKCVITLTKYLFYRN